VSRETAAHLAYGATVVATLLWFAAFVALFRRDLGDPVLAAVTFGLAGAVVWAIGRLVVRRGRRHAHRGDR
jgi:hypothetical protein